MPCISVLLCRVRDLRYGHYEAMGVDSAGDAARAILVQHDLARASMDLARLTMDSERSALYWMRSFGRSQSPECGTCLKAG